MEEGAVDVVEAVEDKTGGGPDGVLQAKLEADVSLENDEVLEIWGVDGLGEELIVVWFVGGEEGFTGTVLEDTWAEDEGFGSEVVWIDCGEGYSVVDPVEVGHLEAWDGAADGLLEKGARGICVGEGWEGPSRTGHDPCVLRGVGADGKSFCIFPEKKMLINK